MSVTELVKSVSIANLANQRQAVMARVEHALTLLAEANQIALAANLGFPRIDVRQSNLVPNDTVVCGPDGTAADALNMIRRTVDAYGWDYLMDESGLRSFMDATARRAWSEQLGEGTAPEFTAQNIEATFKQIHASRGDMFDRGVIKCFSNLSWDYKTNQPFKFGKRVILKRLCDKIFGYPHNDKTNELDDLVRVFSVLDGKPEPDHRGGCYAMIQHAIKVDKATEAESEYFGVKWFKNGNGHLTFKRPDLVEQMNKILSRHYPNAIASEVR